MVLVGWSHSLLESFMLCKRKGGYILDRTKQDVTYSYFAEGIFLHTRAENFYDETWNPKKSKPKYKTPEGYGGQIRAWWLRSIVQTGKSRGILIEWNNEKDPYIRSYSVKKAGIQLYNDYSGRERPLLVEAPFDLKIEVGRNKQLLYIKGKIDEIRKRVIRDVKTGFEEPTKPEQENGRQLTFYAMGVSNWIANDEKFANMFGISEDERKKCIEDAKYLTPEINLEYYLMKSGKVINVKRTKEHAESLLEDLVKANETVIKGDFKPNVGLHCRGCHFKYRCAKDGIGGVQEIVNGQRMLFSKKPTDLMVERVKVKPIQQELFK